MIEKQKYKIVTCWMVVGQENEENASIISFLYICLITAGQHFWFFPIISNFFSLLSPFFESKSRTEVLRKWWRRRKSRIIERSYSQMTDEEEKVKGRPTLSIMKERRVGGGVGGGSKGRGAGERETWRG